jgi:hypothetical protein
VKPAVLEQARERLELAEMNFEMIRKAENYKQFRLAWTQFLLALNAVYSKLEQGVKGNSKCEAWWGVLKNTRRKDPLLQYLHQARNADEHGIQQISYEDPASFGVGKPDEPINYLRIQSTVDETTIEMHQNDDGTFPTIFAIPWSAQLVPVTDSRFGDTYTPVPKHLGGNLPDTKPETFAEAGLEFTRKALDEAAALPKH